jgi:hypothetical protein
VQGPTRVAVLGPLGDTLRAFPNAPSTPGVHRLLWDMRGRPAARTLSPAEKRDSVENVRRTVAAIDSLVAEKVVPAPMAERIKQGLTGGPQAMAQLMSAFGGGGGGGAGPRGTVAAVGMPRFAERPAESGGAGGAGGGAARGEGAQSESTAGEAGASMDQGVLSQVFQAVQAATRRSGGPGGFFGRGGGAGFVPVGTYQVVVVVNGETTRVPLRVERVNGGDGAGPLFGVGDDEHEP